MKITATCLTTLVALSVASDGSLFTDDLLHRATSEDPRVRHALVLDLVTADRESCDRTEELRYSLSSEQYRRLLTAALPGLANRLSLGEKLRLLHVVDRIALDHDLPGVDRVVAEFLKDASTSVQRRAVDTLVRLRSPLATPYVLPRLRSERSVERYRALKTLEYIGDRQAIPHVAELLQSEDRNTQHWATWCLHALDARETADLVHKACIRGRSWRQTSPYVLAVLLKWGDKRAQTAAMAWLTDADLGNRSAMVDRLIEVSVTAPQIETPLISFLQSEERAADDVGTDANIRADVMRCLGRLRSQEAVPVLRKTIRESQRFLAHVAARQLGIIGSRDGIPDLLALLNHYGYSDWAAATEALAGIGEASTVPAVLEHLASRKADSHHVKVLALLAKVSDADLYSRLTARTFEGSEALTVERRLDRLADAANFRIILDDDVADEDRMRITGAGAGRTVFSVLVGDVAKLNYSGYRYAIFLSDGTATIASIPQVYRLWDTWLERREDRIRGQGEAHNKPRRGY